MMVSVVEGITIRKLKECDANDVKNIYELITKQPVNDDFLDQIRTRACRNGNEAPFVAEIDGKVIGFMITYIVTLGFGAERSAYIATLGVHPKYMGYGVGTKMGEEILKFYKSLGITRIYTSVPWDHTDLLSFCKTMGFERSNFINLKRDLRARG